MKFIWPEKGKKRNAVNLPYIDNASVSSCCWKHAYL